MTAACGMIFWLKIHHCQPLFACQGKTTIIRVAKPGKVFAWNIEFFCYLICYSRILMFGKHCTNKRDSFFFPQHFYFFQLTDKAKTNTWTVVWLTHMVLLPQWDWNFFQTIFCNFFQTIFNNAIFVPLLGAFVTVRGLDCWEFEIEHKVKQCLEI